MKTLIILLFPLITFGQLRKEQPFKIPFDMFEPTGQTISNKVKVVIIAESCLIAASICFMKQGNQPMYRATRNIFLVSTIPLLTINFDKPHKKRHRK